MVTLAEKRYLELERPTEADGAADCERILRALTDAHMPLATLKTLSPMLNEADYRVTATLCPGASGMDVVRVEPGDTRARLFGLALDVGSTALEMALVDLNTGNTLADAGATNGQVALGANILDRIFAVRGDRRNLETLRTLVVDGANGLIDRVCAGANVSPEEIAAIVIAGNTTMMHFLLGCDPWYVFQNPYAPAFFAPEPMAARELGLKLNCNALIMPAVANYLGGDITSGLLLTDMESGDSPCLFLDIGTNGELALGNRDYLIAGAGAAGPALEGAVSAFGMRAEPGAVDRVRIDENNALHIHVIGGGEPRGICGSGLLDLIAQGYLAGWINGNGTLDASASERIERTRDPESGREVLAIRFAENEQGGLLLNESDIAEFIRCKAAAHTMVETLLEASGVSPDQIGKMYLSGGFGTHYDLESAITVGLYPDIPREKFCILGNSSLGGAKKLLLNRDCRAALERIRRRMTYVQFGEMGKFVENMVSAQFIPHTDAKQYPSVKRKR